ncbi:hypothetical protein [Microvirga solisilvae]|uniref:hypothetical protein n=1 Tax=Microvirga solisilvae TaxID=2919498 RepID=UPI001FAE8C5C|nr:hypothetical protein [Microvirga solisilvae]
MTELMKREFMELIDPFTGDTVQISADIVDRLEGRYAIGPTLPNGEPEFGWRQHEPTPINLEAAKVIRALRAALSSHEGMGWRLIETAPTDREIEVCDHETGCRAFLAATPPHFRWDPSAAGWTHWREPTSLPAAPSLSTQES